MTLAQEASAPEQAPRRRLPGTNIPSMLLWLLTILTVIFLVGYPVIRVIWLAFSDATTGVFDPSIFLEELADPSMWEATRNTVVMALAATVFAAIFAVPMAWFCERTSMPGRKVFTSLVFLTFMTPPLLTGIAYISLFGPNNGLLIGVLESLGIDSTIYSWWGLILVTACGAYAIIFMTTSAALAGIDGDLENAARAHGATSRTILTRVSMPLVRPAIASGCLLAFVLALNAFGVQALIATPARISLLTTTIYSYFSYPVQFTGAASQSVVLIVISMVVTLAANWYILSRTYPTIAGKGARADLIHLGKAGNALGIAVSSFAVGVSVVVPIIAVLITSVVLIPGQGYGGDNLGLNHYRELFSLGDVGGSLWNSLRLGVMAATGMVILALALAYFKRRKAPGAKTVFQIGEIPYVIPGIVVAVGFIAAYSRPPFSFYGTAAILVMAYIAKFLPVALRFTENALGQVSNELEEAAYAHGAREGRAFRRILMPLMRRGLVTAWILAFIFGFNELSASILLIGTGTQVSSTVLLHYAEEGLIGHMNAFAAVLFAVTAVSYAIVTKVSSRSMSTASF